MTYRRNNARPIKNSVNAYIHKHTGKTQLGLKKKENENKETQS